MAVNSSAAMELKVLINVLSQGTALPQLLAQTKQLGDALTTLQNQVNAAGQTGGLGKAAADTATGVKDANAEIKSINPQIDTLAAVAAKATSALKFLAGGFLGLRTVQFLKNIADTAARTEVLNTVLHIVAMNAGITEERVDRVVSSIQRLGITAQASREALTKFLQSGLKLEGAEGLARAAQDLAVISGRDSSETFQRLIVNIQQLDTMGLRFMGIVVNRVEADQKYKAAHREITGELDRRQKQEALLMEVVDKARTLEGAYEAAMGNVGKQLTSLRRYYEDLRSELGKHLLPAYSAVISELSLFLAKMQDQAILSATNTSMAERMGTIIRWLSRQFFNFTAFLIEHRAVIELLVGSYIALRAVLIAEATWAKVLTFWTWLNKDILLAYTRVVNLTKATWGLVAAMLGLKMAQPTQLALPGFEGLEKGGGGKAKIWMMDLFAVAVRLGKALFDTAKWARLFAMAWEGIVVAGTAIAGVITAPITALLLLVSAIAGVVAIAAEYTRLGPAMSGAFGGLLKVVRELGEFLVDVFLAGWKTLVMVFNGVVSSARWVINELGLLMQKLEEMPGPGNPLTEATKGIKDFGVALDWLAEKIKAMREGLEGLFDLEVDRMARQLGKTTEELAKARGELTEAEVKGVAAKKSGIQKDIVATGLAYDAAKAKVKGLEDRRSGEIAQLDAKDPERTAVLLAQARKNELQNEFDKLVTSANTAMEKMKVRVEGGVTMPREFAEQIGSLDVLVRYYEAVKIKSKEAVEDLKKIAPKTEEERKKIIEEVNRAMQTVEDARQTALEKAQEMLPGVGAKSTLAPFLEQLNKIRPYVDAEGEKLLKALETQGRRQASIYRTPLQTEQLAQRRASLDASAELLRTSLDNELNLLKSAHEEAALLDQDALEHRRIGRDQFYTRQRARAIAEYQLERGLAQKEVDRVKKEQAAGVAITPEEQKQLDNRLAAAQGKVVEVDRAFQTKLTGIDIGADTEIENFQREINSIRAKNAAAYGDERAQIEVINLEYAERLKSMKIEEGSKEELVLMAQKQIELDKLQNDFIQQRLQLEMAVIKVRENQLDLSNAILATRKSRVDMAEQEGILTPQDAMKVRNAQVQEEIENERINLRNIEDKRIAQAKALDDARAAVIESQRQREAGGPANEKELATRLEALQGAEDAMKALNIQFVESEARLDSYFTKLQGYGKEFKKTFQDSLTTLISDLAMQTKSLGEAFESFGKALQGKIVNAFATNMASKVTKMISDIGRARDEKGNVKPDSPTFFDRVFKAIGLGTPPDGSKDRPFHVFVTNPQVQVSEGMKDFNGKVTLETGPLLQQLITSPVSLGGLANSSAVGGVAGALLQRLFGRGGGLKSPVATVPLAGNPMYAATGGPVRGPGTGTSDSIPAWVSAGEHIMPADKAAKWMPLLEGIRMGTILPSFALGGVVALQSIANPSVISRRYASGGVVVSDAGAASVQTGGGAANMTVALHPDAMNMTLREWLEQEVVRQHGRR